MAIKPSKHIPWQQLPLLRFGFFFGLAITIETKLPNVPSYLLIGSILFLAILSRLRYRWTYRKITGGIIYTLAFLCGFLIQNIHNQQFTPPSEQLYKAYQGQVTQQKITENGMAIFLQVNWAYDSLPQAWIPHKEKVWIFIKDTIPDNRKYQTIIFWKRLKPPSMPKAPDEFNFKDYLHRKHIDRIAYLDKGEWLGIIQTPSWRDRQVSRLRKLFHEPQHSGLLAALVFGDRRYLPRELQDQYAKAGAIHVLAVSGLHVGMVLLFLQAIFRIVPGFRGAKGRKYSIPFQIIGIWSYAGMTGWSTSVCRASIMLSLLLMARGIRRNTIGVNSLAGAALILLVYDPTWLFNIGFQFSCLAVLGILLFQKSIFRSWNSPHTLLRWFWELNSVSLAAQLTTFPLGLYYFNQFPIWFLLSGSLVIPLAPFLIGGTALILFLDWLAIISPLLFIKIIEWILLFLNNSMAWMAQHSPDWLSQSTINQTQLFGYFFTLLILGYWWISRRNIYLFYLLTTAWITLLINTLKTTDNEQFILGKSATGIAIHYACDQELFTWTKGGQSMANLEKYYQKEGVHSFSYNRLPKETALLTTHNQKSIMWLPIEGEIPANNQPVDYLIVEQGEKVNPTWAAQRVCPDGVLFIFDYLRKRDLEQWRRVAIEKQINLWYFPQKGGFLEVY